MMSFICNREAVWISDSETKINSVAMLRFKKEVFISKLEREYIIHITADSRYRLLINGIMVANGPCRTTNMKKYIDEVDIAQYLKRGTNTVEVLVAHYDNELLDSLEYIGGPASIVATAYPALFISDLQGNLSTNGDWLVRKENRYEFVWLNNPRRQICYAERINNRREEGVYNKATVVRSLTGFSEYGQSSYFRKLDLRPIPMPFLKEKRFSGVKRSSNPQIFSKDNFDDFIVPKDFSGFVEFEAEKYSTGFIKVTVKGKAEIGITTAEGYYQNLKGTYKKTDRKLCVEDSKLIGITDELITCDEYQEYITYDYRAFAFVRFDIVTGENPVQVSVSYVETGYPLELEAKFECDDKRYEKLWDVSLNTLKCCMYETYMDCPCYEQLQYIMDTYLQLVYTASVAKDMRLARKAIDDFYCSMSPDGDMPCCSPARYNQYIWCFPIFWIFMLEEYYRITQDISVIKNYFWGMTKLIDNLTRDISSKRGLVEIKKGWSFVDWADGWHEGTPVKNGEAHTIYSMMLAAALDCASRISKICKIPLDEYFLSKASELKHNINGLTFDIDAGLYNDTVGVKQFSMHAQIWAVLSGCVEGKDANLLLEKATNSKITEISYCYIFFALRAFEKTGNYNFSKKYFDMLLSELDKGLTTLPEDCGLQRSDCHAWSAVALYEMPHMALGIHEQNDEIVLQPSMLWLEKCAGRALIRNDLVSVKYEIKGDNISINAQTEKNHNWKVIVSSNDIYTFSNRKSISINLKKEKFINEKKH